MSSWHPSFFEGHEDDGHGGCIRCRFYVFHTDDEYTVIPYPCAFAQLEGMTKALKVTSMMFHGCDHHRGQFVDCKVSICEESAQILRKMTG